MLILQELKHVLVLVKQFTSASSIKRFYQADSNAIPSPRGFWGLSQIELWSTVNPWTFHQISECQAPHWKLSGDGSAHMVHHFPIQLFANGGI